jgi:phosphatidylserine/phosphatidylglycerophosphate/cardiolipin synthase-like enzyme
MAENRERSTFMSKFKLFAFRALAVLLLLGGVFGGGTYYGYQLPRAIDPQDYIQTHFMPYESGIDTYLEFMDGTRHSLRVAIYNLSEPRVVDKAIELKQRGINDIIFLLDKSQTVSRSGPKEQALIKRLRDAGIEVVVGTSEQKHNIMHLKVTIRDGLWVEDGSWNYSKSANTQANDINIIKSPKRAALFLADWQRMYAFMKTQDQTPWTKVKPAETKTDPNEATDESAD